MRSTVRRSSVFTCLLIAAALAPATAQETTDAACGAAWTVVASPNGGSNIDNGLSRLAVVSANDIWAVGSKGDSNGRTTLIERWNGSSWTIVPSPNGPNAFNWLIGVDAVSANDVWAVGYSQTAFGNGSSVTLVLHWNGSTWTKVTSPNPPFPPGQASSELFDVTAVSANDVWAVGRTYNFSDSRSLVMRWNGSAWNVVPNPDPDLFGRFYAAEAISANNVWAVGTHYVDGVESSLIQRWNGTRWQVVPSPNVGPFVNSFNDISASSANDIWVVGYHLALFGASQQYQTSALHWNGSAWSVVPTLNNSQLNNYLFGVTAIAPNDVWAVGFWDNGSQLLSMIQHWDGNFWSVVNSPNSSTYINELTGVAAVSANDVWAVGQATGFFNFETFVQRLNCPAPGPAMHVSNIQPSFNTNVVRARVTIQDANNTAVAGATVSANVTLPDSTTIARSGTTDSLGRATISVPRNLSGTYSFAVTNVTKAGLTYDPNANNETTDSIVVP